jgi:hypothetical protein
VDMLSENEEVISFYPGSAKKGQITLGRIVVHDRLKVEADVLPRYFNHSSFASLRRQLNYFSFTRMGKGRQRGATYCNEAVIEIDDILRLKRRSTVGPSTPRDTQTQEHQPADVSGKRERSVSLSSSSVDNEIDTAKHRSKKSRHTKHTTPTIISPRTSPVHHISSDEEPRITLDLTVPSQESLPHIYVPQLSHGDADILAGCKALLSFSKGLHFKGEIGAAVY